MPTIAVYLKSHPMQDHYATCCENCHNPASTALLQSSMQEWGHALCRSCQANFKMKMENSIWEAISLCVSLQKKGVDAQLVETGKPQSLSISLPAYQMQVQIDLWQKSQSQPAEVLHPESPLRTLHIAAPQLHAGIEATASFVAEYVRNSTHS